MKKYLKILALFVIFFFIGCADEFSKNHIMLNDSNVLKTQYFPKDRRLKIGDKPYFLFFFSSSCGVCKKQIPILNELNSKLNSKIQFIGVLGGSMGFDKDIQLLKEHNINFKTTSDKISVDYFSRAVGGIMGVPASFIFDKNGNMVEKFIGLIPEKILKDKINLYAN
ncbi:protein disulfide reductase, TlpA family [Campylobacter pinnipediorum subsp. caledonicus]|uniref:Protein disulfide reductase, TlpA family n=1 Tax=Campylobacter pinnipediorum subsp. caledonicus TaxID=1874362 RepID=A0A1S6U5E3_9BACT|nr:TlpA disulfide reductase family protein [Campylobacter pinnipediorum]AQW86912.1 protein disulfide reductase, TlpA family [Campylobacter pinnipediorum subsp. caledonicus]OPA71905.1 thioredoxin [Campylobacter pinnipediorum subsp. caledonicus]